MGKMNNETFFSVMLVWLRIFVIAVEVEYPRVVSGQPVHEHLFPSAYRSCYGLVPGSVFLSDFIV